MDTILETQIWELKAKHVDGAADFEDNTQCAVAKLAQEQLNTPNVCIGYSAITAEGHEGGRIWPAYRKVDFVSDQRKVWAAKENNTFDPEEVLRTFTFTSWDSVNGINYEMAMTIKQMHDAKE